MIESEFLHNIAGADDAGLDDFGIDPPQVEILAHGRIDKLHGIQAEASDELFAAVVWNWRHFEDGAANGQLRAGW